MKTRSNTFSTLLMAAASAALIACSNPSGSTVAPSPSSSSSSSDASGLSGSSPYGATISGTVTTTAGVSSIRPRGAGGLTVTIVGTQMSSAIDASGSFTLQHVIPGDIQLQFTGGTTNATIDIGTVADGEQLTLTLEVSGTNAQIDESASVTLDNQAEIDGRVTSKAGQMLTVGSTAITVPTTGVTIMNGSQPIAFGDINVGDLVHVQATRSGSTLTATAIQIQNSTGIPIPGSAGSGDNSGSGSNQGSSGSGGSGDNSGSSGQS